MPSDTPNDSEKPLTLDLFEQAHQGDVDARRAAVERIQDRVVEEIRRRLHGAARAQSETMELANDLFVTLLNPESRAKFASDADLVRYLTRAISLRIQDQVRAPARRRLAKDGVTQALDSAVAREREPSEHAERAENSQSVRDAIDGLPEAERRVVQMRVLEERAWDEIATALGMSAEAARSAGRRGIARLGGSITETS